MIFVMNNWMTEYQRSAQMQLKIISMHAKMGKIVIILVSLFANALSMSHRQIVFVMNSQLIVRCFYTQ